MRMEKTHLTENTTKQDYYNVTELLTAVWSWSKLPRSPQNPKGWQILKNCQPLWEQDLQPQKIEPKHTEARTSPSFDSKLEDGYKERQVVAYYQYHKRKNYDKKFVKMKLLLWSREGISEKYVIHCEAQIKTKKGIGKYKVKKYVAVLRKLRIKK